MADLLGTVTNAVGLSSGNSTTSLQLYTGALLYLNGAALTEEAEVRMERTVHATEVYTIHNSLAGFSSGNPQTTIDVRNAVPAKDFELNPGAFILNLQMCELTMFAAGRVMTAKGFITKDNFDHAVNKESTLAFTFVAKMVDWR